MEQVTVKVSPKARDLIRLVAAMSGEKQYEMLERILEQEKKKLQAEEK